MVRNRNKSAYCGDPHLHAIYSSPLTSNPRYHFWFIQCDSTTRVITYRVHKNRLKGLKSIFAVSFESLVQKLTENH